MGSITSVTANEISARIKQANESESLEKIEYFLRIAYLEDARLSAFKSEFRSHKAFLNLLDFLNNEHNEKYDSVISQIRKRPNLTHEVEEYIQQQIESPHETISSNVNPAMSEFLNIALDAFPRYLRCKSYQDWQWMISCLVKSELQTRFDGTLPELEDSQSSQNIPLLEAEVCFSRVIDPILLGKNDIRFKENLTDSESSFFHETTAVARRLSCLHGINNGTENSLETALYAVDIVEVKQILTLDSWFLTFLGVVENLPLAVSIATANTSRLGFPIIYANKMFETMTGYDRGNLVGHSAKFLQKYRSSQQLEILELTNALQLAHSSVSKIMNFRKDGTPFLNMIGIKPIFDIHRRYCYVIAVHMDVTNMSSEDTERCSFRIYQLLNSIPSILRNSHRMSFENKLKPEGKYTLYSMVRKILFFLHNNLNKSKSVNL